MKNPVLGWLSAAYRYVSTGFAQAGLFLCHTVNRFPAFKRGLLACALCTALGVPFAVGGLMAALYVWPMMLLALFLGLGAERHTTVWDSVFSLPPMRAFAFWRWHALERRRFIAALIGLVAGALAGLTVGGL